MLLLDQAKTSLTRFPGADLLTDAKTRRGALLSRNVEFVSGDVRTRRGYDPISFNPNAVISRLYDWIDSTWRRLIYYVPNAATGGSFHSRNRVLSVTNQIIGGLSVNGVGATIEAYGARLLFNTFGSDGRGTDAGYIWNGLFESGAPVVDTLFQTPISGSTFTSVFTQPAGVGTITAGLHRFALIWVTRNGYESSPTDTNAGGYLSFTATGDKTGRLTLTPTGVWPTWARQVRLVLTTASDPNTYYFTGVTATVPWGFNTPLVINFDIDDTTLARQPEALDWFDLSDGGSGSPKLIFKYGRRMCYAIENPDAGSLSDVTDLFISEPDLPQWITANRHLIRLPGNLQIVSYFVLGGNLYLLGPTWCYVVRDTTDYPVNWPPPEVVDESIGTLSPHGAVSNTAKGVAWVASIGGLYLFRGGSFEQIPVSYYQSPDWARINWTAPTGTVKIIDDAVNQQIKVAVPLDGAVQATHIMTWDYSEGFNMKTLRESYSLDDVVNCPNALEIVRNDDTEVPEVYVACKTALKIFRQKSTASGDALLYNDNGSAIDSQWIGPAMPEYADWPLAHRGAHIRIRGAGSAIVKAHSADLRRTNEGIAPIELETSPENLYYRDCDMQSEACHWEVTNGDRADHYFILSGLTHYYIPGPWVTHR